MSTLTTPKRSPETRVKISTGDSDWTPERLKTRPINVSIQIGRAGVKAIKSPDRFPRFNRLLKKS